MLQQAVESVSCAKVSAPHRGAKTFELEGESSRFDFQVTLHSVKKSPVRPVGRLENSSR